MFPFMALVLNIGVGLCRLVISGFCGTSRARIDNAPIDCTQYRFPAIVSRNVFCFEHFRTFVYENKG